jgi:GTPase SAR1 family protein
MVESMLNKVNNCVNYQSIDVESLTRYAFPETLAKYPSLECSWTRISDVHQMYFSKNRNKGLLIYGQSGEGKTFLVNKYQQNFPPIETPGKTLIPVFYCRFKEAKKSIDDILRFLIRGLGVTPPKGRTQAGELSAQFFHLIRDLGVQLIILDEIQQVLPEKEGVTTLNTLKYFCGLLDELRPSIIFIGSEKAMKLLTFGEMAKKTIDDNEQLSRRMLKSIKMNRIIPRSNDWLKSINWFLNEIGFQPLTKANGDLLNRIYIAYGAQRSFSTLDDLFLSRPFSGNTVEQLTTFLFENFNLHCHNDINPFDL